jgi:hypothetical protein
MALDRCSLGDVWQSFDGTTFAHVDDGVDGDMAEANVKVAKGIMIGHLTSLADGDGVDGCLVIDGVDWIKRHDFDVNVVHKVVNCSLFSKRGVKLISKVEVGEGFAGDLLETRVDFETGR